MQVLGKILDTKHYAQTVIYIASSVRMAQYAEHSIGLAPAPKSLQDKGKQQEEGRGDRRRYKGERCSLSFQGPFPTWQCGM